MARPVAASATIPAVDEDGRSQADRTDEPGRTGRIRQTARAADSRPQLVATARFIRRLLPGDDRYGDALSTTGRRAPERIGRLVSEMEPERPSAVRELGLGALQAWQALSEAQGRGRGTVDVAILFTDIVKFSGWALDAGDEAALELLRQVAAAEDEAISNNGGSLVKRLGDGSMSVFASAADAVRAALRAHESVKDITVEGHTPTLRTGVHVGRPRRVAGDYLGVDVNIAARVGECAKAGEVLVSDPAHAAIDGEDFRFGRRRRLREAGAPRHLSVRAVTPA
jgi:adenylate cyclase